MVDDGFSDDHQPKRVVPKRVMHRTLPVYCPTDKAAGGGIRAGHPLMADAIAHFDTDPGCVRISAYPVSVVYFRHRSRGGLEKLEHIPDLGVLMSSGRRVYLDCIPFFDRRRKPWLEKRAHLVRAACLEQFEADYAVHSEDSLHIQPRFSNIKIMRNHRKAGMDANAEIIIRKVLHELPCPTDIDSIRRAAGLPPLVFEKDDGPAVLHDVDRTFSALMRMAMAGEVVLDLSRPFDGSTIVDRTRGRRS